MPTGNGERTGVQVAGGNAAGIEAEAGAGRGAVARAASLIGLGNILSRLLGLAREGAIAHYFGAGGPVSAFRLALQIPQIAYDLLIGGLVSAALVPVFSEYAAREDREELGRLVSAFCSLAAVLLALVVLLLEVLAPWAVAIMGGGLEAQYQAQAVADLRLVAPALLFLGLSGALSGLLYALKRFTYPAFATAVFNAGIVLLILLTGRLLGIAGAAVGVVVGAFLQLALQLPGLRGTHLRPTRHLAHPALKRILLLYLPVLLGVAISIVGTVIDRRLASETGASSIAWMQNATTLIQTPLGLIAAAVSLAVLPSLSRASASRDERAFQSQLGLGLRLILTLVVPATVGLYALGRPLIALLFEHGAFMPDDTRMVTLALYLYLLGLPFAAVDQLLIFAFYARRDTLRPNLVGAYAIGIYLLFALPLVGRWGMFALVLANSAQWTWHALFMLLLLHRQVGWPKGERIGATLWRSLAAAAGMGLAAWGTALGLETWLGEAGTLPRLLSLGAALAVAVVVYPGLAVALRLEEVKIAWEALRRHLGG
ncbi:MAG: murein biosynthesis integral membrane protein MurJ [Chloroflexia bacterium]